MNQFKIDSISTIKGYILLIFYTSGKCWQFRVISPDGSVFGESKIYYTPQAAREAGVSWVSEKQD